MGATFLVRTLRQLTNMFHYYSLLTLHLSEAPCINIFDYLNQTHYVHHTKPKSSLSPIP